MILKNVRIAGETGRKDIHTDGRLISSIQETGSMIGGGGPALQFDEAMAFPGLVNSHDHLDFDLFPQYSSGIYRNYTEWGHDIQANFKAQIGDITKIPRSLRVRWGLYKNLLAGVTTVVHHGEKIEIDHPVIDVYQEYHFLHSLAFEKNWKLKLFRAPKSRPVVIHVGEGRDEFSRNEIDRLIRWNLLGRELVAVHGVAMTAAQARSFKALVWCPASNEFMLGGTAQVSRLKDILPVVLGTDSTLTSSWNLWDHLRLAERTAAIDGKELMAMLSSIPASVWNLHDRGSINDGKLADIVIADHKERWSELNPENILLVLKHGQVIVADESLEGKLEKAGLHQLLDGSVRIGIGSRRKLVHGNLPGLMNDIKKYNPEIRFPVDMA